MVRTGGRWKRTCHGRHLATGLPVLLRSRASALVSVRRVTELNAGRLTAGVDGKVVVGSQSKAEWADWAQNGSRSWTPRPVRRVYVPWERWFLRVTKKAIEADYLVHHDTPRAARSKRTHLVHATCSRSRRPPRLSGNTVMQQTT